MEFWVFGWGGVVCKVIESFGNEFVKIIFNFRGKLIRLIKIIRFFIVS